MKLITAVNNLDTIFEIDLEGDTLPEPPASLVIEGEPVVVEEIVGRNGSIVAVRVIRGAQLNHVPGQELQAL